jgi:hypothetical protein
VRPVYQLWRDGQTLQLQLAEERSRYSKLQQSTDANWIRCVSSNITQLSWIPRRASWKT